MDFVWADVLILYYIHILNFYKNMWFWNTIYITEL